MNKKPELKDIVYEIYRELFKNSEPKADFDEMLKTGEAKKEEFFMSYYLEQEKQTQIMETIMNKYHLGRFEKEGIRTTVNLGCSPNTCKETWEKRRNRNG